MTSYPEINSEAFKDAGYDVNELTGEVSKTDNSADLIIVKECPEIIPDDVLLLIPFKKWFENRHKERVFPLFSPETFHDCDLKSDKLNVLLTGSHFNIEYLKKPDPARVLLIFTFNPEKEKYAPDHFLNALDENNLRFNIVLNPVFHEDNIEDLRIKAASLLGRYIIDKRVSGISVTNNGKIDFRELTALAFSILQCTGSRITQNIVSYRVRHAAAQNSIFRNL